MKESYNLTGLKTTVNFARLANNVAATDALLVERLQDAGAVVLGKTNIPTMLSDYQSFGPLYPAANNPYDLARTPGGSTGGGGAAVAAGLTSFELGGDIGGSIRVPSHFCGLFGLKPTENGALHGRGHVPPFPNSRAGFVAMDGLGPLARTMDDIELAWGVINKPTWDYFAHLPAKPSAGKPLSACKVAWLDDLGPVACGRATREVLNTFVGTLQAAGVQCEKRPFDEKWLNEVWAVWGTLFGAIAGQDAPWIARQLMKRQFAAMTKGSITEVMAAVRRGLDLGFRDFSYALSLRVELVQELQRRFAEYDFIISPIAAGPAFFHNHKHTPIELDGRSVPYIDYTMPFTIIYNSCGNPSLAVPAGRGDAGLPIGLQIGAPHYAEHDLIHFAKQIEQLGVRFVPPHGY